MSRQSRFRIEPMREHQMVVAADSRSVVHYIRERGHVM